MGVYNKTREMKHKQTDTPGRISTLPHGIVTILNYTQASYNNWLPLRRRYARNLYVYIVDIDIFASSVLAI